jgi:hypothetical protein
MVLSLNGSLAGPTLHLSPKISFLVRQARCAAGAGYRCELLCGVFQRLLQLR